MNSNVKTAKGIAAYAVAMALATVLVASNANAGEQTRSATVKFADLNLDTSAGAEALYGRIHSAARRICFEPIQTYRDYTDCVAKSESEAIAKVNAPLLTAVYQKKTGNTPAALTANR